MVHIPASPPHPVFQMGSDGVRAGVATHLALLGASDDHIQSVGCWQSDTFERYIRKNPVLIQHLKCIDIGMFFPLRRCQRQHTAIFVSIIFLLFLSHTLYAREPHEYVFVNMNIRTRGQINTRVCTSIDYIILANIPQVLEYSCSNEYSRVSVEFSSFNYLWGSQIY
jgi:hypothetical protein